MQPISDNTPDHLDFKNLSTSVFTELTEVTYKMRR